MKRALILILALSTLVVPRDKKAKARPGPYAFTSKASAQTLKVLIVQANLREGYTLDSDNQLQFRFSKPAQMPVVDAVFTASSMCKGMITKKVWSYTLVELKDSTRVIIQPVWEYPDDYCRTQTQEFIWSRPEEIAAFQAMLDEASISSAPSPSPASRSVAPASARTSADQQRRAKQQAACLELAKDNPSISCK
jgi:hypothetical protein